MIDDARLAEIEARLAASTLGPWSAGRGFGREYEVYGAGEAGVCHTFSALPRQAADQALLLAEVRRLRAELADAVLVAHVHDKLQDGGPHNCARCRREGRREGLLEAAGVMETRAAEIEAMPGEVNSWRSGQLRHTAACLRALAGQIDAGSLRG